MIMPLRRAPFFTAFLIVALAATSLNATLAVASPTQTPAAKPPIERTLDAKTRRQLGDIIAHLIENLYVVPDASKRIAAQVRAKFAAGAYDAINSPAQLAEALTRDLREIGKDKHLYVRYDAASADAPVLTSAAWEAERQRHRAERAAHPDADEEALMEPDARQAEMLRRVNNYFRRVERLEGNVGYLDLGGFAPGSAARETAAGALAFLSNTDALIIDLRRCPGGAGDMVGFLSSYFFGAEPRVLMKMYFRPTDSSVENKTVANVPGRRMTATDLYILTSPLTGSACEAFSYSLQQYGRAKIVGEPTAGAGYANSLEMIGAGFVLSVSVGRPEHPRSGKGWEGVGVQPDIATPAANALAVAHAEALKKLASASGDEGRKQELTAAARTVEASLNAAMVAPSSLQGYVGKYGENKTITVQEGALYYQRVGGRGGKLVPLSADTYSLNDDAKITFIRDAGGNVTEMIIAWKDRPEERLKRAPLPPAPTP
jgi:uncharacterized protein YdeI (BOF family)